MPSLSMIVWLLCALVVTWAALQDVGLATQAWLGVCAILALGSLRAFKFGGLLRTFVILLAAFMTVRYLGWRTFSSLPPYDSSGFVPGLALYLAELHAIGLYFLGIFVNLAPIRREPCRLPQRIKTSRPSTCSSRRSTRRSTSCGSR